MGLYFFKNATEGGDWIIQERLENDAFVSSLLPDNAPLSTMRVISASRCGRFHLVLCFSSGYTRGSSSICGDHANIGMKFSAGGRRRRSVS